MKGRQMYSEELNPNYMPIPDQLIMIERPVRSMRRFYGRVPSEIQQRMKWVARNAGRMNRCDIEAWYRVFEREAEASTVTF